METQSQALISVIMPAHNAQSFIAEAIASVLDQTHNSIELIIINDGSTDRTEEIIKSLIDPRIIYLEQENQGVSSARNLGLQQMNGKFFCFLDADDIMPKDSISRRLAVFQQHIDAVIVGGAQHVYDASLSRLVRIQVPEFVGHPSKQIALLDEKTFINCGTWLIKRAAQQIPSFPVGWTHLEDAVFFYLLGSWGKHYSCDYPAQYYRLSDDSAMSNTIDLAYCYLKFIALTRNSLNLSERLWQSIKVMKVVTLIFVRNRKYGALFKWYKTFFFGN